MKELQRREMLEEALDRFAEGWIAPDNIPGMAVRIKHRGNTLYDKCFGFMDYGQTKPMERDTICRIYSMTKPVTAVAVHILIERGLLEYHAPLKEYLPEFSHMMVQTREGLVPAKRDIELLDLLRMTSGIVYPDNYMDAATLVMNQSFERIHERLRSGEVISTRDMVREIAKNPLAFHPGEGWRYGFSADVMGAVIEVVTGMSLGEFYRREIFGPLEMWDTDFRVPEGKLHRLADLYECTVRGDRRQTTPADCFVLGMSDDTACPGFEAGGAGLYSTLEDYSHFVDMLVQGGIYKEERILGRKTIELMTTNQLTEQQKRTITDQFVTGNGYASFQRVFEDRAVYGGSGTPGEFGWSGWTGPYEAVDQEEEFSIVMLMQVRDYDVISLYRRIRNIAYAMI